MKYKNYTLLKYQERITKSQLYFKLNQSKQL